MNKRGKTPPDADDHQSVRDKAELLASERLGQSTDAKTTEQETLQQELHVHQIELELQNEELRQTQARLEYTHQQYLDLYNEAPIGYASLDDAGLIIRANQMLANMLGVEKYVLTGRALVEFMLAEDQGIFRSRFKAFAHQPEGKHIDIRFRQGEREEENKSFVGRLQGRRIAPDASGARGAHWTETLLVVVSDVTELKKSEERIHFQAYHDGLTGIPNRATLYDQLENALSLAKRHDTYGAVLFMDLDRFKNVNDSLGHQTGDQLLIEFTKRLREHIRKEDLLVRMGGDEFVVQLAEQHHDNNVMAVIAQRFAEHIAESLSEPLIVQEHLFQITLSIGISIFPFSHEDTVNDVIRQADTAMYQAKSDGRGMVRFFHANMQDAARQRMTLEAELRVALMEEQFELYYQPQYDWDGQIHALEVLLRWQHPYRGMVSPDRFISVAEDTGMIVPLGEWVIKSAVKQIAHWLELGVIDSSLRFAINVSAKQLESVSFCQHVEDILSHYELSPHYLVFEITESLLLPNDALADDVLNHLSTIGLTFSVDDFGTGFSSLSTMQKAPIGQLKIDKGFVTDLRWHTDSQDEPEQDRQYALVDAILSLGKALGLEVVAEGVETEEQVRVLRHLGCRYMQGYYYSKPSSAEEIIEFLKNFK